MLPTNVPIRCDLFLFQFVFIFYGNSMTQAQKKITIKKDCIFSAYECFFKSILPFNLNFSFGLIRIMQTILPKKMFFPFWEIHIIIKYVYQVERAGIMNSSQQGFSIVNPKQDEIKIQKVTRNLFLPIRRQFFSVVEIVCLCRIWYSMGI